MLKKGKSHDGKEKPTVNSEEVLERAGSAYEAVVAIAKEARRLNTAPEVFLGEGEKAIPKAVENFMQGKVEYEIEDGPGGKKSSRKTTRKSRKAK